MRGCDAETLAGVERPMGVKRPVALLGELSDAADWTHSKATVDDFATTIVSVLLRSESVVVDSGKGRISRTAEFVTGRIRRTRSTRDGENAGSFDRPATIGF